MIGVTSAYMLARSGYDVTVIDRNHAVGRGTSQVNACSLRVSTFSPINSPGSAWRLAKALMAGDPVFHFAWSQVLTDPSFWRWGLQFARASLSADWHATNTAFLRDVSKWSVELTKQVARDEGIAFHLRDDCGVMVAYVEDEAGYRQAVEVRSAPPAIGPPQPLGARVGRSMLRQRRASRRRMYLGYI